MLETRSVLKAVLNDKEYTFHCDPNAPINDVQSVLFQFQGFVSAIIKQAKDEAEKASEAAKVSEESKINTEQTL